MSIGLSVSWQGQKGYYRGVLLKPFESLYKTFCMAQRKREILNRLSYAQFFEFTKISECHYCGMSVYWKDGPKKYTFNLDRKDNLFGYDEGNCVVCCARCNYGKGDRFSYTEWLIMGRALKRSRIG